MKPWLCVTISLMVTAVMLLGFLYLGFVVFVLYVTPASGLMPVGDAGPVTYNLYWEAFKGLLTVLAMALPLILIGGCSVKAYGDYQWKRRLRSRRF